jgi:hypothetical protein
MYQAELRGKLSSKDKRSEDLLTSNVFSFFKYANREIYLRDLLRLLGLEVTKNDLNGAEFKFWPSYDDRTEPDVVIIVGDYYILFEAKYTSGFGQAMDKRQGQLERELAGGLHEARAYGKEFVPAAITAHSSRPFDVFADIPDEFADRFRWINWQSISSMLLTFLEGGDNTTPNYEFASDLYYLLEDKRLRGFVSFDRFKDMYTFQPSDYVFFAPESATFRGGYIGFQKALSMVETPDFVGSKIFFKRQYFHPTPSILIELDDGPLFWKEGS